MQSYTLRPELRTVVPIPSLAPTPASLAGLDLWAKTHLEPFERLTYTAVPRAPRTQIPKTPDSRTIYPNQGTLFRSRPSRCQDLV